MAFNMQKINNEINFLKRDDRKKGMELEAILVKLTMKKMSPQHPISPTKFYSDFSASSNSSEFFNKPVNLDEDVHGVTLQILDDLLDLSEEYESRA